MNIQKIGERLLNRRVEDKLSYRMLATRTGVSANTLKRMCDGTGDSFNPNTVNAVLRWLDATDAEQPSRNRAVAIPRNIGEAEALRERANAMLAMAQWYLDTHQS